jgi:uncharacterized protein (TIGR02145 family)
MKTRKIVTLLIALLIVSLGYAQQTLIENFETPTSYTVNKFEGLSAATIEADPAAGGTRGNVLKMVSVSGGNPWQGAEVIFTASKIRLTTDKTMTVDVYATQAFTLLGKAEVGAAASATSANYTTPNAWQTLTFNFANAYDGTAAANGEYSKIAFFPNWKSTNNGFNTPPANFTLHLDNITGVKVSTAPAFVPPVAPTPTTPNAEVFSLFGDTGGFTNKWVSDYSFGGFLGKPDLDTTAGVNTAIKMDFSNQGYGEGLVPEAPRKDVSAYGFLNFDYYVKSGADNAGSLGHQFYIDLISRIGATNTEGFYAIGSTVLTTGPASEQVAKAIVFDSWQTVSVPLSAFVGGFSPANFFQFRIGASSDLRTKVVFFDNIYFSANNPLPTPAPTASAQTFCGATTVASLVATGTDLKWYANATGGTPLSPSDTLSTQTYYVSQTLNTIESDRTAVAVTVTAPLTTSAIRMVGATPAIPSVTIGTQTWTAKNLDVATYRDGTPIPQVTDPTEWANLTTGAWCYYNNDPANGAIYGKLYNWYAVAGIWNEASKTDLTLRKKLAPTGYHVSSDAEWTTLTAYLGGASVAGGKMKEEGTLHWTSPNTEATNSSGFAGLPGGYKSYEGEAWTSIGDYGYWWFSSDYDGTDSVGCGGLNYDSGFQGADGYYKSGGLSVRCLRD